MALVCFSKVFSTQKSQKSQGELTQSQAYGSLVIAIVSYLMGSSHLVSSLPYSYRWNRGTVEPLGAAALSHKNRRKSHHFKATPMATYLNQDKRQDENKNYLSCVDFHCADVVSIESSVACLAH